MRFVCDLLTPFFKLSKKLHICPYSHSISYSIKYQAENMKLASTFFKILFFLWSARSTHSAGLKIIFVIVFLTPVYNLHVYLLNCYSPMNMLDLYNHQFTPRIFLCLWQTLQVDKIILHRFIRNSSVCQFDVAK